MALLEPELDAAGVEFARHDAHLGPVAGGGAVLGRDAGGGERATEDCEQRGERRARATSASAARRDV